VAQAITVDILHLLVLGRLRADAGFV